jgi:hypothetical protein
MLNSYLRGAVHNCSAQTVISSPVSEAISSNVRAVPTAAALALQAQQLFAHTS